MEEKASSASMALDKHRTMPGSDETQKSAEESIMEEKKESKRPPIKWVAPVTSNVTSPS